MSEPQELLLNQAEGPPKWRSSRFLLCYMSCAGLMIMFFQRVSMSLAIVCMVNHTALYVHQNGVQGVNISDEGTEAGNTTVPVRGKTDLSTRPSNTLAQHHDRCPSVNDNTDAMPESTEDGPFAWDKQTQGLILAALYIGYLVGHIPLSLVVRRFGIRMTIFGGYMVMSLCHILCHPAALLSPWAVFALRIAVGFFNAWGVVSFFYVWMSWAPVTEQCQLVGITFCGEMIGSFAAFPLTSLLCRRGFWDGWPSVFYIFGAMGVVWSMAWFFLVRDSPEDHPWISPEERLYIITTRGAVTTEVGCGTLAQYSAVIMRMFLMLSNLPLFLKEVMYFDIQSNGVYSMLPYILMFLTVSGSGFIVDSILNRRLLSKLALRRLVVSLAFIGPAVLLIGMNQLQCDQGPLVVALVTVAVGLSGLSLSGGHYINPLDIAPRYAFSLFTLANFIAITAGIINPYMVAVVTADGTREQWQIVFYITGGVYVVGTIIFCVLGRADIQPWAAEESVSQDNVRRFSRRLSYF